MERELETVPFLYIRRKNVKVLLFEWPAVNQKEMASMLTKYGCQVFCLSIPFKSFVGDWELEEKFEAHLKVKDYDFVFSINYFDMIAEACHRKHVKYVAWTYDSPTYTGDPKILSYDTNYVFMFDRIETERYRKNGYENVYHLPLAVNCDRYEKIHLLNKKHANILQSDISFVGRLYENNLPEITSNLDDYYKAFLNALVDAQMQVSGYNIFNDIITQEFMTKISTPSFNRQMNKKEKLPWDTKKEKEETSEAIPSKNALIMKLNKAVTNRERLLILQLLARHHHMKLFSDQKSNVIQDAILCGPVDYYTNMPKVFKHSKINMNITLRSIESGIPLRCLDIMGCGGLLMSNYQLEFDDYFQNGRDLLIYYSAEDALEKANYYLNPRHETERAAIAKSGYEIVKKYYSYEHQFEYIWEKAELGDFPILR